MEKRLLQLSKDTGVPLKKIYDFLYILKDGKQIDNAELLRMVGISKNALNQIKKSLSDLLEIPSKNTQLVASKLEAMNALFEDEYKAEEYLMGSLENDSFRKVVQAFKKYKDARPEPVRKYDQFTATIETVARRAALMHFLKDIDNRRIAFIGDDDFTSISIALISKPERITVFEIDKRIIKNLRSISQEAHLPIEVVEYDARKKIPTNFKEKYDIVFTDPPYTLGGLALFLSRSVDLLDRTNKGARVYICYGNSDRAKERFLPIQKALTDAGLMLRWVFNKFSRYTGADSIGSSSNLYIADITDQTHPLIQGEFNEKIYTI